MVQEAVEGFMTMDTTEDELTVLVKFLIKTYSRMRGRDYCCQIMCVDFNNLGKALWSTVAALSNKENYAKKKKDNDTKGSSFKPGKRKSCPTISQDLVDGDSNNNNDAGEIIHVEFEKHVMEMVNEDENVSELNVLE